MTSDVKYDAYQQVNARKDGWFLWIKITGVQLYRLIQIIFGIFWSNFCDSEHYLVKDQLIITLPAQSLATIGHFLNQELVQVTNDTSNRTFRFWQEYFQQILCIFRRNFNLRTSKVVSPTHNGIYASITSSKTSVFFL